MNWDEHTIGSEIILGKTMELLGDVDKWKLVSVSTVVVLISIHDRCTDCAKCETGSEIILGTADRTPR
jgi:hypothetical protein